MEYDVPANRVFVLGGSRNFFIKIPIRKYLKLATTIKHKEAIMTKRIRFFVSFLLLFSLFGCSQLTVISPNVGENAVIPFIRYDAGKAYRGHWNLGKQEVFFEEEALFTNNSKELKFPIGIWDAEKSFTFYGEPLSDLNPEIQARYIDEDSESHPERIRSLQGKNAVAYGAENLDTSKGYMIDLYEDTFLQSVSLTQDSVPQALGNILFQKMVEPVLTFVHFQDGVLTGVLYLIPVNKVVTVTYSTETETWEFQEAEADRSLVPPKPYNCVLLGDILYFLADIDVSALDIKNNTFYAVHDYSTLFAEQREKFVANGKFGYSVPYYDGNDILFIFLPISGGEYVEHITFAMREGNYLGALHYRDGRLFTYDAGNNRTEAIEGIKMEAIQFPATSGF